MSGAILGEDLAYDAAAAPFVKWVGGKRGLVPTLLEEIPTSALRDASSDARYVEPFVGGGALFFEIQPRRAILGDINRDLVNAYRAIKSDVEAVIAILSQLRNDKEDFLRCRALDPKGLSPAEAAARLIYLNKTCFNGLYRENRKGQFNTSFGSYEKPVICDAWRLRACARALRHTETAGRSFELIDPSPADVIYCDPPYWGTFSAYTSEVFGPKEHARLADWARRAVRMGAHVTLSNADTPEVRDLYADGFRFREVQVRRSVNSDGAGRGKVGELIITGIRS